KDDMNKYYYLLAQHEKGDVDKKDVEDLKHYLFNIGTKIDAKDADELPPIERKPDYSKISSEGQLIYDSFGNVVNKAKSIDYSDIPTDDQLPKEPGKVKVNKSTEAVDRDYGLDLSSYKDMIGKNKSVDTDKPKRDIDYSKISSEEQILNDLYTKAVENAQDIDYNKIYDSFGFEVNEDYDKDNDKKTLSNIGKGMKESADWAKYGEFPTFTEFPNFFKHKTKDKYIFQNKEYANDSNILKAADTTTAILSRLEYLPKKNVAVIGKVANVANNALMMFEINNLYIEVDDRMEFYTMALINTGAQMYNNDGDNKSSRSSRHDETYFWPLTEDAKIELEGKSDDEIEKMYNDYCISAYDYYSYFVKDYATTMPDINGNKITDDLRGKYWDELTPVQKETAMNYTKISSKKRGYIGYVMDSVNDFVADSAIACWIP
ncbi:MAG: hypothetical protein AAGU14_11385, partial [Eubacteriaceae bacterium]